MGSVLIAFNIIYIGWLAQWGDRWNKLESIGEEKKGFGKKKNIRRRRSGGEKRGKGETFWKKYTHEFKEQQGGGGNSNKLLGRIAKTKREGF